MRMAGGRVIQFCASHCRGEWILKSGAHGHFETAARVLSFAISTEPLHPPLPSPLWLPPGARQIDGKWTC
jgi:hypothetical protein